MEPRSPYQPRPQEPHYVDRSQHPGQQYAPVPQQPLQTPMYGEQPGTPQQHDYNFIMNPVQPPVQRGLPGGSSLPIKIAYGFGLLLVVLVVITVGRNLLAGGNNFDQYIGLMASQEALIKIAEDAEQQEGLPAKTQEFIYTAEIGLNSNQTQIISYLATNKKKVDQKQLLTKVSATTQTQLDTAKTAGNYDEVMRGLMKDKLNEYRIELQSTYKTTEGPKGKKLLTDQYNQAGLLLKQVDAR